MNRADAQRVSEWAMEAARCAVKARKAAADTTAPPGPTRRNARRRALQQERIVREYANALLSFGSRENREC